MPPINTPLPPNLKPESKKRSVVPVMVAISLLIILGVFLFTLHRGPTSNKPNQTKPSTSEITKPKTSIRLLATGDWIAHDSVNAAAKKADGTYDYSPLIKDFEPIFKKADIRFCNDPILNGGKALGITGYPKFNSPTEFVTDMAGLGCNLINTASNHSFDFSQKNITASMDAWDKQLNMLAVAGQNRSQAEHDAVHYFTVSGVKFAFLAYTTYINTSSPAQNSYGVNVFSESFAAKQIAEAKKNDAQIIIVSMRWGTEYATSVDSKQRRNAQFLADQGVDIVLGHGSHALQPVKQLKGKSGHKTTVWFGLGNFLNTQVPPETLFNGVAVIDFDISSKQTSIKGYLPIYMHYEWTAAEAAAGNTNARNNVHLYLLEDATPEMLSKQQLKTSIDAQKARIIKTLAEDGASVPLLTSKDL